MITRMARLQILAFLVVSALGISYVGVTYVGLADRIAGRAYLVHADFDDAGGIFANAPVTYRGVSVGRVVAVGLHGDGVRVALRLQRGTRIPTDLHAVVSQRSAVGEQYVDLRPDTDTGPYLRDGSVIPRGRTGRPLPPEVLLTNLDALVRSVDPQDLAVVIDELGTAFQGSETALRRLLDATGALLDEANRYLPQTRTLIRDGDTVLTTQIASSDAIGRWAAALAELSATLRGSDPDLRRLLAAGPPAAQQLTGLLHDLDPTIGTLLGNLVTVNGIAARRVAGIEQALVTYPLVVAGGFTVTPGDGTAHFGLVTNLGDPPPCNYAQSGQQRCTAAELSQGSNVRGSAHAPRPGGDPAPAPGGPATAAGGPAVAGYDPATGLVTGPDGLPLRFGGTGGQYQLAGAQSWKQLLLTGIAP
ncbi:MCE family protein [Planosporangium sp. 12N6]|uniref:MCE family protein n=1 Tax=Planosporangium spinosum TaxID=3402278 RepID=UPI003CEE841F